MNSPSCSTKLRLVKLRIAGVVLPQGSLSFELRSEYERVYRVIHKSLRDFRPLRYSNRDGHAEGEHVNRGRDTPSFCPTLKVLDMLTSEGS